MSENTEELLVWYIVKAADHHPQLFISRYCAEMRKEEREEAGFSAEIVTVCDITELTTLTEERDRLRELALPFAQCWCGEENQPCNCNNCRLHEALTPQESEMIPEHMHGDWLFVAKDDGKYLAFNRLSNESVVIYEVADYASALSKFERMFP